MATSQEMLDALSALIDGKEPKSEALSARTAANVKVEWAGKQIILPEIGGKKMTLTQGIDVLRRMQKDQETPVEVNYEFDGWPLDGARALSLAIRDIYGLQELKRRETFFGTIFPKIVQVEVDQDRYEGVPWGDFSLPGIEESRFEMRANFTPSPKFLFSGRTRKKYEGEISDLAALTRKHLRENSIYRGKAIKVDLSYSRGRFDPENFTPENFIPRFMRLAGHHEDELIVNADVQSALEQSLYARIELPQALVANDIALRHGILLEGPYGVGKTLLALIAALKAVKVGRTFIYLRDTEDFVEGMKLARTYAPSILFGEDVDKLMPDVQSDRPSPKVQAVSTALDGIDSKDDDVIVILTTNRPEIMYKGLLRAGRIDTPIHMDVPDESTAGKFVLTFGGKLLHKSVQGDELERVAKELAGYAPAFIREAIAKAKIAAIYRLRKPDITGQVNADDLTKAARMLKSHVAMATPKPATDMSPADAFVDHLAEKVHSVMENGN